jgi:IMP cyclohydrolase
MAEKSLTGKTLSGEYIDENIEIVEVMKLQDEKDEIILKIKRENGKIAEIVSESDSWLGYEIGQKLFVRMRLKDENPVAICWVMGND